MGRKCGMWNFVSIFLVPKWGDPQPAHLGRKFTQTCGFSAV